MALNHELNNTARNTNDTKKLLRLVSKGADLLSTNGDPWNHTPMHQAAFHDRPDMVSTLVDLAIQKGVLQRNLSMASNPCGRGGTGTPLDLAKGGGHIRCTRLLEDAMKHPDAPAMPVKAARVPMPVKSADGGRGAGGKIEFLGLWRDEGTRAMPIKVNVNADDKRQIHKAFGSFIEEMKSSGSSSGLFAAQSYNQMHWTTDSSDEGYKKHGFLRMDKPARSYWSGKEHPKEGITFEGFEGVIDILGGDWENAVYRVTIDDVSSISAPREKFDQAVSAPALILVHRDDSKRCVFDNASAIKAGKSAPFTLSSHPGKSVGRRYSEEKMFGPWRYTESGVYKGTPISVSLVDGKFLKLADADLVLDVSFWKMDPGNTVNFVGGTNSNDKTKLEGGGRDWTINDDGTISPMNHPYLALGTEASGAVPLPKVKSPAGGPMTLVNKGDPKQLIFINARSIKQGRASPFTLSSHVGMSVGRQYSEEKRFGEWRYIESEINKTPVTVSLVDGKFLKLAGADLVLDVSFWKMEPGTSVNFVGGDSTTRTKLGGGGRDWKINDDGTISAMHYPHLVLGCRCEGDSATADELSSKLAGASLEGGFNDIKYEKPGPRFTYDESARYAASKGGELLTLQEARGYLGTRGALYPGEDVWCAVQGRDWVQVGNTYHHAGKSHVLECHHYPPWGDNANDKTYGNATWNHVVLYKQA